MSEQERAEVPAAKVARESARPPAAEPQGSARTAPTLNGGRVTAPRPQESGDQELIDWLGRADIHTRAAAVAHLQQWRR